MVRYLGLDLSLSCPGFAVIEVSDGKPMLITKQHVKTNGKETHGKRLAHIQAQLIELIGRYYPFEQIVRERGFSMHAATTQTLFKVVGVVDLTFNDDPPIVEIPPTTVKKTLTGNGKASKAEVAQAVKRYLGEVDFVTDDESDACAVILAYLIREEVIVT